MVNNRTRCHNAIAAELTDLVSNFRESLDQERENDFSEMDSSAIVFSHAISNTKILTDVKAKEPTEN